MFAIIQFLRALMHIEFPKAQSGFELERKCQLC